MIDRVNRRLAPATRVAFPVLLFAPPRDLLRAGPERVSTVIVLADESDLRDALLVVRERPVVTGG